MTVQCTLCDWISPDFNEFISDDILDTILEHFEAAHPTELLFTKMRMNAGYN